VGTLQCHALPGCSKSVKNSESHEHPKLIRVRDARLGSTRREVSPDFRRIASNSSPLGVLIYETPMVRSALSRSRSSYKSYNRCWPAPCIKCDSPDCHDRRQVHCCGPRSVVEKRLGLLAHSLRLTAGVEQTLSAAASAARRNSEHRLRSAGVLSWHTRRQFQHTRSSRFRTPHYLTPVAPIAGGSHHRMHFASRVHRTCVSLVAHIECLYESHAIHPHRPAARHSRRPHSEGAHARADAWAGDFAPDRAGDRGNVSGEAGIAFSRRCTGWNRPGGWAQRGARARTAGEPSSIGLAKRAACN
jgi:hypothetical protein